MLATDLLIAARNLMQHRRRNFMLGSAIAAVTLLLVLLNGITNGIQTTLLESATTLITGHVNIGGFYKVTTGTTAPFLVDWETVAKHAAGLPELDHMTSRGRGYAKAVSAEGSMDLVLSGVDVAREPRILRVLEVTAGDLGDLVKPNSLLLFADQAKRLKVGVGDDVTLSSATGRGVNNTIDMRVAVIARNIGLLSSFIAFIPNPAMRQLYQVNPSTTGAIHLYLKDPEAAPRVAALLRTRLAEAGYKVLEADPVPYWEKLFDKLRSTDWTGQRLDVTTWDDEMSFMKWILNGFRALSGLLVAILMIIVVIGIMNTMWIAIRERTREIGTMRAIGMHRRRVALLFLLEAFVLGVAGAVGGALVGGGVAAALNAARFTVPEGVQLFLMAQSLFLSIRVDEAVIAVVTVIAATTLAALYPSVRAARLAPVTAMHHIG